MCPFCFLHVNDSAWPPFCGPCENYVLPSISNGNAPGRQKCHCELTLSRCMVVIFFSFFLYLKETNPSSVNIRFSLPHELACVWKWAAPSSAYTLQTCFDQHGGGWGGGAHAIKMKSLCSHLRFSQFPLITLRKTTWRLRFHKATSYCWPVC